MTRRLQLVAFAAGAVFLAYLVAVTGPATIARDLARTGWTFGPIVLVWAGVYVCNTLAWTALQRGTAAVATHEPAPDDAGVDPRGALSVPLPRAFAITVSAFAINYVTPFVSLGGEPFKGAAAARWVGARRAAASVVGFRIVHSLGQFVFWALTVPVAWAVLPANHTVRALLVAAGLVLIPASLGGLVLMRARLFGRALDALARLGRVRLLGAVGRRLSAALEPRRPALAAVDAELAAVARQPAALATALAAEIASRFLSAYEFVLVARVAGVPFDYADAVVAAGVSQVFMNLLFFVPFEAGTREGGLFLVARLLGLSPAVGVYAALVTRLREFVWIGIGLLLIWATGERGRERESGDRGLGQRAGA